MPQRFLRPGITNSDRWNRVDWRAQGFYIRLLTLVDDFGRCDGRTSVLHGSCYSVWNELNPREQCKFEHVSAMLTQLANAKLIELYELPGKRFVQIVQWQERIRDGAKERWPDPQQVAALGGALLLPSSPPTPSPTPTPSPRTIAKQPAELPAPLKVPEFEVVWADWRKHRAEIRKPLTPTTERQQLEMCVGIGVSRAVAALKHSMAQGWQGIYEAKTNGIAGPVKKNVLEQEADKLLKQTKEGK